MIPLLAPEDQLARPYQAFVDQLRTSSFRGEIRTDYATRLVHATDNSVYQLVPQVVLYPRDTADIQLVLAKMNQGEHREVRLSPRGGGTGTNGQSLCDGIMMDVSRHMKSILEVNLKEGWALVEPGVVLDQLNAHVASHGVFFAPNLSPSNRATVGGMVSTDASGKGSRVYGKTSEHVLETESVLLGGELLQTARLTPDELLEKKKLPGAAGRLHREIADIVEHSAERLEAELPKLHRFLTGYDLAHVKEANGSFDLGRVISGSEGTLSVLTKLKLRLTPLPGYKELIAIRYADFDAALRAAQVLAARKPGAIETIDKLIVSLAREDVIWYSVAHLIDAEGEAPLAALNLVEFEGTEDDVKVKIEELCGFLDGERGLPGKSTGYTVARAKGDIQALWSLRKKGVGLLGNVKGERRPVPFVEDTVVPPEHLADYIKEFRALLDSHGLRYGMFGHVDVGCLHVRPALDLKNPEDERRLGQISDGVVRLVKKYGGVLWGEHGRGYRSQYTPTFFGPELYAEMRKVKGAFDPHNQLNPGKLATPPASQDSLVRVRSPSRGSLDRQIPEPVRAEYATAIHCNGNGACFDWNPNSVMCPSTKVRNDRMHSPKGRAGLLREWLRLATAKNEEELSGSTELELIHGRAANPGDFSHEVYDAMQGCVACKACATDCPVKVDIPSLRSEFLAHYHSRYRRPLKDYFTAILETSLRVLGRFPRLANFLTVGPLGQPILRFVGLVDTPKLAARSLSAELEARGAIPYDFARLAALEATEKANVVLLVQDVFTTFYETNVALATYDLLKTLGFVPVFLPFRENGKALHIKGFLGRFRRVATRAAALFEEAHQLGFPLVGIEPAVTLTYRDEYAHLKLPSMTGVKVELLQEFLQQALPSRLPLKLNPPRNPEATFRLFAQCQERTMAPKSQAAWKEVFRLLGVELELTSVGCCGMCGVYGHEAEHQKESRGLFEMSWQEKLRGADDAQRVLATGHSCRSQVKRFGGFIPQHPAEALVRGLAEANPISH